ncbi:MAG: hypothetical protein AB7E80_09835 [Hyphomicrobiaceae bacterium]
MPAFVILILVPLTILAASVGMALTLGDPVWLVLGAVLAIATAMLLRGNSGR